MPFSVGIIISSTFIEFSSGTGFSFTIFFSNFISSDLASPLLWDTSLEAVFTRSSSVFVAVCINFPHIGRIDFLQMTKIRIL